MTQASAMAATGNFLRVVRLADSYRQLVLDCEVSVTLSAFKCAMIVRILQRFRNPEKAVTLNAHVVRKEKNSVCSRAPTALPFSSTSFCKSIIFMSNPLSKANTCCNLVASCTICPISISRNGFDTNATVSSTMFYSKHRLMLLCQGERR